MKTRILTLEQAKKIIAKTKTITLINQFGPMLNKQEKTKEEIHALLEECKDTLQLSGDNARKTFKAGLALIKDEECIFVETDKEALLELDPLNFKNYGIVETVGQLRELIEDLPDDTSFGFRNQPQQEFVETEHDGKKLVSFQELPIEEVASQKNLFNESIDADYFCKNYFDENKNQDTKCLNQCFHCKRDEINIESLPEERRKYKTPQKDGFVTAYDDGIRLFGGWSTRLNLYKNLNLHEVIKTSK